MFNTSYRVYYEDTDAGGIVYYANYLKFAERARTDWLRSAGFSQQQLREKEGIGFVVRQCSVDYIAPLRLDDIADVSCNVTGIRRCGFTMQQIISSNNQRCANIEVTIICVDAAFKPVRLSPVLHKILSVNISL